MSETKKHFEMNFKNSEAKAKKVIVAHASENIAAETAKSALESFVNTDMFNDGSGDKFVTIVNARYVTRTVDDVYVAPQA